MHPRARGLLKLGAAAVAVISLTAGAAMWGVVSVIAQLGSTVDLSPDTGDDLALVVADTQDAVAAASEAIRNTATLGEQLQAGSSQTAAALASSGRLIETDVADSLSSVQDAMPALIDAGQVIDSTLRTLSLFGVDYDPPVPFDQALVEVQTSLNGLPEQIRQQGQDISALAPTLEATSDDTATLVASLSDMAEELDDVAQRLSTVEATVGRVDTIGSVVTGIETAQPIIAVLLGFAVVAGLGLSVVLWRLSNVRSVAEELEAGRVMA